MRTLIKYGVAGPLAAVVLGLLSPAGMSPAAKRVAPRAFAVALAAPTAGDVTYGIAQVRIAPGPSTSPAASGDTIFAQHVGGLAIMARSTNWRALRATTRVYVAVSTVPGAGARVRDVAFFILRRRTRSGARSGGGALIFTLSNTRPAIGSFWVHGVDRRGYADIFHVRNILATALGNWTRYLRVLAAAHALAAAMHPVVRDAARAAAGHAPPRGRGRSFWTGGQRPSARVRAVFRLILSTLGSPDAYAAAKKSPLVRDFMAHELRNPGLARRWRAVTARLPLKVPDSYAAGAQEEALFTRVTAPRVSPSGVLIHNWPNSSDELVSGTYRGWLDVVATGPGAGVVPGSGVVTSSPAGVFCRIPDVDAPGSVCEVAFPDTCGGFSPNPMCDWVTLTAIPDPGSIFAGWSAFNGQVSACLSPSPNTCILALPLVAANVGPMVWAGFDAVPNTVSVIKEGGSGSGSVTSTPSGIDCGSTCSAVFGHGATVTLTATPDAGSTVDSWVGCDSSSGPSCRLTVSSSRTVYVTFRSAQVLTITRFAGDGSRCASRPNCGDGPDAKSAQLTVPEGVARDAAGNLYIADTGDNEIRKVAPDGTISRIAGNGQPCTTPSSCGDGGRATDAELDGPTGVAVGSDGTVYIADYFDDEIREVATDGTITTLAGDGRPCVHVANCGDGGPAAQAELDGPTGVAVGSDGSVYIADRFDNEIRNVAPDHTIKTVAGNGTACMTYPNCGDTGLAVNAQLDGPSGVAVDSAGNFYIADSFDNEVRQVFGGRIFRLAGDGTRCTQAANCGDGGPATHAQLNNPTGVAVDPSGNVYVADQGDNAVREIVAQTDFITRTAGNGGACTTAPTCGDGGPGPDAQLASPFGVALDPAGNIYIADTSDNEVRKLG